MAELLYTTPYPDINNALSEYIDGLHATYGLDLTAVYLLGSLVMDDYVPGWSDIDGLVVLAKTDTPPPAPPLVGEGSREEGEPGQAPHPSPLREGKGDKGEVTSPLLHSPFPRREGGQGVRSPLSIHMSIHTIAELRQPDWRTNPLGMVGMASLFEYGRLLWGTDIRRLLVMPRFPSLRAYLIAELARIIRERPMELPVRAPKGAGGPKYKDRSVEMVNWLFYPARILHILETARVGSKTMAVVHYTHHHFDAWEVWLRWAEAYRRLPDRKPLTPKERKHLALAVQDFFWEVVNFILLGLGHDPETLTTDEAVLEALEGYVRKA